ncbi:MAG TPA: glycosyltransferase family 2 protein [Patescibacteria group bacterium]|nr:glycosyltransferase family 2 protein [Patescibacteria group bacterium]
MTDSTPVVSVLIPCWNAATSIERALDSVLEERTIPLECVVVDDGSTDRTLDVARAVAARDPRVVVLALDENRGVSNARNRGLQLVRGEWLTLLDADDRFLPGGLGTLAAAALRDDAAAVIGQQIWWDGRRHWRTPRYDVADIRRPGRKSLAANPGLLNYVSPHAKLLRRDCWDGLEFSGRALGDQPWIIRALLRAGDRIDVLAETVYEWYRPAPTIASSSITATTRSSVERGVEAIGVASEALASVRAEAASLLDEAESERVGRRYAERLLRSDLAAHVARALDRRDPQIGSLFQAIGGFVTGLPPGYGGASDALARNIVEPPLRRWHRVAPAGRPTFWRLFETALEVDPDLPGKGASPLARLGLRIAATRRNPAARRLSSALLVLARVLNGIRRRLPLPARSGETEMPG